MFLQDLLQVIQIIFEYSMKMLGIHRLSTPHLMASIAKVEKKFKDIEKQNLIQNLI